MRPMLDKKTIKKITAKCRICKRTFTDPDEVRYIKKYGFCLICDHLSLDIHNN